MDTFFENSSHFTVQDSQLYNAKHITINNHRDTGTLTEVTPGNWCRTIPGDETCSYRAGFRTPPVGVSRVISVNLVRSSYTVQITSPSLSYPGAKFTAVFYDGPDVQQAYEDDLHQYSTLWNINFAKLFGITHWGLPALIFQSDMIPFSEFYEQQCTSPVARGFLSYQAGICMDQAKDHLLHYVHEGCRVPDFLDTVHVWIQPSGHACVGPRTPFSFLQVTRPTSGFRWSSGPSPVNNFPLGLTFYKSEKTVMQHLDNHLKEDFLSWVLHWMTRFVGHGGNSTSIPLSIGCVYLESKKQIVAQIQYRQKIRISGWSKYPNRNAPPLEVTSTGRAR
ncbi:hypothetical protein BDP27DRAFT_347119 [Rhodocollybia butyracea]|uniref:Uncharacterized protein n=1 Tax=Rhodocollybia butyracea TaxID=206335 RepID=A0A9P5Q9S7_9AGAR|nr:hypothetical protein BDP27DRAFT_347119 [Rhodocollybia butyracea]